MASKKDIFLVLIFGLGICFFCQGSFGTSTAPPHCPKGTVWWQPSIEIQKEKGPCYKVPTLRTIFQGLCDKGDLDGCYSLSDLEHSQNNLGVSKRIFEKAIKDSTAACLHDIKSECERVSLLLKQKAESNKDDWMNALAEPAGTSITQSSGLNLEIRLILVKEVRPKGNLIWVAGKGGAIFGKSVIGWRAPKEVAPNIEITIGPETDNLLKACRAALGNPPSMGNVIEILGEGFAKDLPPPSANDSPILVVKMNKLSGCGLTKEESPSKTSSIWK